VVARPWGYISAAGNESDHEVGTGPVIHVACGNFAFFNEIEKKEPPPGCATGGPGPARTKPELVTYLRESFDMLIRLTAASKEKPARAGDDGSRCPGGLGNARAALFWAGATVLRHKAGKSANR
jgi:hypothetical protein